MDGYYGKITFPRWAYNEEVAELLELAGVEAVTTNGIVTASADYLPGGEFEELEAYFVEQGVPFDRFSGAHIETMPCMRRFRPPHIDVTLNVIEDANGNPAPYVLVSKLRKLLELPSEKTKEELEKIINQADPLLPLIEL